MTATPSSIRVMVVDDSSVVRGMVTRILEASGMQVVATAANPTAALNTLKRPAPHKVEADVLILDVQLSGKAETSLIADFRKLAPGMRIIVAATLNEPNVMHSIDALDQGADELVAKPSSRKNPGETELFVQELVAKVKKLTGLAPAKEEAAENKLQPSALPAAEPIQAFTLPPEPDTPITLRKAPSFFRPKVLAIASSTGGPKALQILFEGIGKRITDIPIFITQHMPKDFTASLALQIGKVSGLPSAEAKEGDPVRPGNIYVAPGDYHLLVEPAGDGLLTRLDQGAPENFCRPAADPMLRSLHAIYGKEILVVVLTGMGQDGLLGAKLIADSGGIVMAQDKITSVVWGMPGAVAKEGVCTYVFPISQLADAVVKICNGQML